MGQSADRAGQAAPENALSVNDDLSPEVAELSVATVKSLVDESRQLELDSYATDGDGSLKHEPSHGQSELQGSTSHDAERIGLSASAYGSASSGQVASNGLCPTNQGSPGGLVGRGGRTVTLSSDFGSGFAGSTAHNAVSGSSGAGGSVGTGEALGPDWDALVKGGLFATLPPHERQSLTNRGYRSWQDIAGLSHRDISRFFDVPSQSLLLLLQAAKLRLQTVISESDGMPLNLVFYSRTAMGATGGPFGRGKGAGKHISGTGTWRQPKTLVSLSEVDKRRRELAAGRVVAILRAQLEHSTFQSEAHDSGVAQWLTHFERVMANSYEAASMNHAAATWGRWTKWCLKNGCTGQVTLAAPSALCLATWLTDVASGGPTAMRGVLVAMKWLRVHLGLTHLPLDSPLLSGTTQAHPEKVLRQAAELPLKVWSQYSLIAHQGKGTIKLMASLVLYIATTALRYKHAQRHNFQTSMCTTYTMVGRVSKGKVLKGAAFYVAGPVFERPGRRTFGDMLDTLETHMPRAEFMVPDVSVSGWAEVDELTDLIKRPMGYSKFSGCLRSMAMKPPLALCLEEAQKITTYSLRRKLASIADRIQMPLERRAELGDWRDKLPDGRGGWQAVKEPMCVRYSAARLETSAVARRFCLQALHAAQEADIEEDEQVKGTRYI